MSLPSLWLAASPIQASSPCEASIFERRRLGQPASNEKLNSPESLLNASSGERLRSSPEKVPLARRFRTASEPVPDVSTEPSAFRTPPFHGKPLTVAAKRERGEYEA